MKKSYFVLTVMWIIVLLAFCYDETRGIGHQLHEYIMGLLLVMDNAILAIKD